MKLTFQLDKHIPRSQDATPTSESTNCYSEMLVMNLNLILSCDTQLGVFFLIVIFLLLS